MKAHLEQMPIETHLEKVAEFKWKSSVEKGKQSYSSLATMTPFGACYEERGVQVVAGVLGSRGLI